MDGIALFAVPFLMAVGMHQEMHAQQRPPAPYVYAAPPGYGTAPGAILGGGIGAMATGAGGGALLGGMMGAAIGHAATTPPYAIPADYASGPSRLSLDWNGFMQPSGR